jgi:O-antigen/teichoic acid export membrane protein
MKAFMLPRAQEALHRALHWSEKYIKTDMVYLFYSGFWSNLNGILLTLFSLGLYIAYAHFLTKDAYGTYQYLLSFFSIATAFTLTGMNTAVTRAVAQGYEGTLRASVRIQLRWGSIPFLGAMAGAAYYFFGGNIVLALGLVFIAIGTPLLYAYNTYGTLFGGRKDFKRLSFYNTSSNLFYYSILATAAVWSHAPLIVLATNMAAQSILAFALYRITLRREHPNNKVDHEALSYGMHLSYMNVFGSVAGQLGNIFIFHFLGAPALALYSFASAMPERIASICFKFLGGALLPKFSERSMGEIKQGLLHKMILATGFGALIALGYIIIAAPLFHLFFSSYDEAIPYSYAISLGFIFGTASSFPTVALTALKRTKALYVQAAILPVAQIAFPLIGIYVGGLWGYLIANLLITLFGLGLSTTLVYISHE